MWTACGFLIKFLACEGAHPVPVCRGSPARRLLAGGVAPDGERSPVLRGATRCSLGKCGAVGCLVTSCVSCDHEPLGHVPFCLSCDHSGDSLCWRKHRPSLPALEARSVSGVFPMSVHLHELSLRLSRMQRAHTTFAGKEAGKVVPSSHGGLFCSLKERQPSGAAQPRSCRLHGRCSCLPLRRLRKASGCKTNSSPPPALYCLVCLCSPGQVTLPLHVSFEMVTVVLLCIAKSWERKQVTARTQPLLPPQPY